MSAERRLSPATLVAVAMKRLVAHPEARVQTRGQMSQGIWHRERSQVRVTQARGKYWPVVGHQIEGQTYLYPEEALFLLEIQQLQVLDAEVPMSVQKAFTVMLTHERAVLRYRVYSHLTRLGYKLIRHQPRPSSQPRKRGPTTSPVVGPEAIHAPIKRSKSHALDAPSRLVVPVAETRLLPAGAWPARTRYDVVFQPRPPDGQAEPQSAEPWDLSQISSWSEWKKNRSRMGPINLPSVQEIRVDCETSGRGFYPLDFWSSSVSPAEEKISITRSVADDTSSARSLASGALRTLWMGPVKPMIPARSVHSTRHILELIRIPNRKCNIRDETLIDDRLEAFKIDFDIFLPNVSFKKSRPGLPNFRVIVTSSDESVPKSQSLQSLKESLADSVPLLMGVVGPGNISFFALQDTSLPRIISVG
ncbi:hypothetical protein TCAL_14352 [Tigriopus californicus]|uniref:tRNA-splicing endonuclease subunit Sen54 N-terminal domain-containing protein n=2 Tax=Tigriopus californicus TaxID=6832 RepID=A0A553NDD8_TIGCA|nr:hypothetical protein TCAL_14352 [Tigriopus californicus]